MQGHLALNQGTTEIVRALFLADAECVPHDKWLVHLSRSLGWTPRDWPHRLATALCDTEPTTDGLRRRRAHLTGLWSQVERHAAARCAPDCPPGPDLLSLAPFHGYVHVRDGQLHLDRARLAAATGTDLHSWHLAVVDAERTVTGPGGAGRGGRASPAARSAPPAGGP